MHLWQVSEPIFSAFTKALSRLFKARVSLVRLSPHIPIALCGNASFFQVFGTWQILATLARKTQGKRRTDAELLRTSSARTFLRWYFR
jgi:hypothetical protein